MRKRITSLLLSLALCLSLLPPAALATEPRDTPTQAEHTHDVGSQSVTFQEWTNSTSLPSSSGNYFLTQNVTLTDTWQPADDTILCLNGKTITGAAGKAVITVNSGISFTLTDCHTGDTVGKITHAAGEKGCGVYMNYGTFNMYGGTITGNHTDGNGGGVCVFTDNFTVSGNAQITGNFKGSAANNAYLYSSSTIKIGTGGLTSGAKIGVTAFKSVSDSSPVTIATNAKDSDSDYFTSDKSNYYIVYDTDKIQLSTTPQSDLCEASVTVGGSTTNYLTVATAIDAVKNCTTDDNATVTLLKNITLDNTLTISSGAFTLDLDGHDLNYRANSNIPTVKIADTANVTLKGKAGHSSGGVWQGGITNWTDTSYAVLVTGGKLTIDKDQADFYDMGARLFSRSGSNATTARALYVSGGEVVINGGFFDCSRTAIEVRGGKLTFNKGRIGWYDLMNPGGNYPWISNYSDTAIAVWGGEVTINDGDLTAKTTALAVNNSDSKVTLNGGSFTKINAPSNSVSDLLGNGYGYKENTAAGTWKSWADCASFSISNVKVVSGATLGNVTVSNGSTTDLTVGYTNCPTLTATAQPSNGASAPTYQWYEITSDNPNGKLISGETNNSYTFPTGKSEGTYQYFCVATSGDYSRRSNVVAVTVKAKTPAAVTISAPPNTVTYGQEFTLAATAKEGENTLSGGTWGWNYDTTYFKLVESNANTGTIKLQAIQAGTPTTNTITANYDSSTHKGSGSVTVSSIGKKVLSASDLEFVGLTGNLITKVYDGTTQHTSDISLSVKEKVNNTGLNITVSKDKITYNSQDVDKATSATLSLDGIALGPNYEFASDFTSITVPASITKATPTVTGTGTASGTYGDELSKVTVEGLTAMLNGQTVEGSWMLTDTNSNILDSVTTSGNSLLYTALFTPTDTTNYNNVTVTDAVKVTVNPKPGGSLGTVNLTQKYTDTASKRYTPVWTELPGGEKEKWSYNSSHQASRNGITVNASFVADGTALAYTISGGQADDTVTFTLEAISHENHYENFTITVVVKLIDREEQTGFAFATETKTTATYGDTDFTVSTINAKTSVSYDSSDKTVATVDNGGKVHILKAGSTTITAKASETADYKEKEVSYTLTVNPKTLTASDLAYNGPITKAYDGTTNAPDGLSVSVNSASLVGTDTLSITGTLAYNSANVKDANSITFTPNAITDGNYRLAATEVLTISGASITKATPSYTAPTGLTAKYGQTLAGVSLVGEAGWSWMNGAHPVGDASNTAKHFKARFTPSDSDNYATVENIDVSVTVSKADARTLNDIAVNQKYSVTSEQSQQLGSIMPNDAGTLTYTAGTSSVTGTATVSNFTVDASGLVKYTITGGEAGALITLPVIIHSNNYADSVVNVVVTLTNKEIPTATANDITVTYTGTEILTSAITGTASVEGSWSWKATAPKNVADSGQYTVVFTPTDTVNYQTVEVNITVTINKATPTGEPKYTAITTSGKKLSDATLTTTDSTFSVPGTVKWVSEDGSDLADTTEVAANTSYKWLFTPTDTNYNTLTGSIELWHRTTSSGGGGSSRPSYVVTVPEKVDNGSVSVSPKNARQGETVTITVTPDEGYVLDKLVVTDKDGKESKLTDQGNGKFTFPMPGSKAEVKVSFQKDSSTQDDFVDVKPGDYFYDAVQWAKQKDITTGTDASHFSPNGPCTRAQIVTFLWRTSGSPVVDFAMDLKDVAPNAYYAEAVRWALSKGITKGTSEDTFSPDAICTREQAVSFLYRMAGSPAVSGGSAFTDVAADAYYASAVTWAEQKGITTGIGDGRFGTGSQCTRAQIVTFLYRASK